MDDIYAFNNTAQNGGFAQFAASDDLTVKNSTFISNHATGDIFGDPKRGEGGAFQIHGSRNVTIEGKFYNNTAMNGSAIYVENGPGVDPETYEPITIVSSVNIHDSEFYDNQALSYYLIAAPENGTTYQTGDKKIVSFSHIGGDNIANAIHSRNGESDIKIRNITFPFYHIGV